MKTKECVLVEGKNCNNCKECMLCDLNPEKICDNCCQCLDKINKDYETIIIDEIILE